jgi:hypothetical protein
MPIPLPPFPEPRPDMFVVVFLKSFETDLELDKMVSYGWTPRRFAHFGLAFLF